MARHGTRFDIMLLLTVQAALLLAGGAKRDDVRVASASLWPLLLVWFLSARMAIENEVTISFWPFPSRVTAQDSVTAVSRLFGSGVRFHSRRGAFSAFFFLPFTTAIFDTAVLSRINAGHPWLKVNAAARKGLRAMAFVVLLVLTLVIARGVI